MKNLMEEQTMKWSESNKFGSMQGRKYSRLGAPRNFTKSAKILIVAILMSLKLELIQGIIRDTMSLYTICFGKFSQN